jgi:hypothetical protein
VFNVRQGLIEFALLRFNGAILPFERGLSALTESKGGGGRAVSIRALIQS